MEENTNIPSEEEKDNSVLNKENKSSINDIWKNPFFYLISFIAIALLGIFISINRSSTDQIIWEYKVLKIYTDGYERNGSEAFKYSTVRISEESLNDLGNDGWELVSTSLEMETAFPNFGNDNYVSGIQPNVRPQGLICIFKRPKLNN